MITSMTGFGKSEAQNDELILSLELRTVNSRFLDFSSRLPRVLISFEDEALKLIKGKCIRGRVTLSVKLDYLPGTNNEMLLNQNKLKSYMQVVKAIQKITKCSDSPTMGDILRLPDIFTAENESDAEKVRTIFIDALKSALDETDNVRIMEGENIKVDLIQRLSEMKGIILKKEQKQQKEKQQMQRKREKQQRQQEKKKPKHFVKKLKVISKLVLLFPYNLVENMDIYAHIVVVEVL